jgi:hypothetical protein
VGLVFGRHGLTHQAFLPSTDLVAARGTTHETSMNNHLHR